MAITTFQSYKDKVAAPYQRLQDTKNSLTTQAGRMSSWWAVAPDAGAVPTTAVAPTRATAGAMGQVNSSGVQRLVQVAVGLQQSGCIIIADRLSHQGGLSGTVTSAQTTNLPTAALTRYADGAGVMMALEVFSQIGGTATVVSASYTNQAGTSGRTSPDTPIGGTGGKEQARLIQLSLQTGDTGVRSVESVTLTATTGTAGNIGVTLFKPLLVLPVPSLGSQQFLFDSVMNLCANMPQIVDDACLCYFIALSSLNSSSGLLLTANRFVED